MRRKPWLAPALTVLVWIAVAGVLATNSHFMRVFAGRNSDFAALLIWYQASWIFWWFASFAVLALARRFPFDRMRWWRSAAVHLAAACAVIVLMATWDVGLQFTLARVVDLSTVISGEPRASFVRTVRNWLPSEASWGLLVYCAVLAAASAREYYRSFRAKEIASSRLEGQLTQARLQVLLMRLQPHFLFNTLNAIAALVRRDPEAAERMISRLSELLRHTVDHVEQQEVVLADELELVRCYLAIERLRFGDRLLVHLDIAPDSLDAVVPQLILQPLVENALHHGVNPAGPLARVEIRSRVRGDRLELEVWDNGRGLRGGEDGPGVGLATTRQRLETLYPDAHTFTVAEAPEGGVAATLELPLRMRDDGAHGADEGGGADDPRSDRR